MKKIDFKKSLTGLYKATSGKIDFVTVPSISYLMCDGHGDPNNSLLFQDAVEALFSLSYTVKFMFKKSDQQINYSVMPLEGLWWTDDPGNFSMKDKKAWKWTLMIMQPEFVTPADVDKARAELALRKQLTKLNDLRLEAMTEGLCAQTLHIGPFNTEPPTIQKLHESIEEHGYKLRGKHREIYLNDMRRTAPEKLKTIIRQPVTK